MTTTTNPMDDRELLELAAKAAGVAITQCTCRNENYPFRHDESVSGKYGHWNPLLKDGDALRLAVKLGMGILYETHHAMGARFIEVSYDIDEDEGTCKVATELLGTDPYAATRRAIVRAAAEIARQENSNG